MKLLGQSFVKGVAMALGLFFVGMAVLAWTLRWHYEEKLRRQIWPQDAPAMTVISNSPPAGGRTVLLLGDSRMAQWKLPQWPHWHVVNAGTSGLTTGQIRLRAAALMDQFHPDVMVFEGGINDLKFLGLQPARATEILFLVSSNISAIVDDGAHRHVNMILLTIWPVGPLTLAHRFVWSEAVPQAVTAANDQLKTLESTQRGIQVVDLFEKAGLKPDARTYLDTLHLTGEAYQKLTPWLEGEIRRAGTNARIPPD